MYLEPINYNEIDEKILPLVKVLNNQGFITCFSCQGGNNHSYVHPTVGFSTKNMSLKTIRKLRIKIANFLIENGFNGFSIAESYSYQNSINTWQQGNCIVLDFWSSDPVRPLLYKQFEGLARKFK